MPVYFTGQTGPALPVNSVQYNSGPGQFAGDANLTWVPASGLTVNKSVMVPALTAAGSIFGLGDSALFSEYYSRFQAVFSLPITDDPGYALGARFSIAPLPTNSAANTTFQGLYIDFTDQGAQIDFDFSTLYGFQSSPTIYVASGKTVDFFGSVGANAYIGGSGTVNTVRLVSAYLQRLDATASVPSVYSFYAYPPELAGGTIGSLVQFYGAAIGGASANPYSFWSDEQGVFRIKSDNTFNSVYQAIPVLYNPQFTKYVAGAANYERIVLGQWSSNVGQIGIEAGGTGTLRAMDLIGASVGFPLSATNGQNFAIKILTELTTIAAAATTDTAIQIPANAVVFGVDVRVTVAIPTAATFTVIGAGSSTVFNTAAVTVAANSTDKGTKSCPFYNATAQAIRITPDIQPGANSGRVRVTIHYYEVTAATS